jgi:hypothetical protein
MEMADVLHNNCVSRLNFIQLTCYAALRYLADFKAGWSFGEGQPGAWFLTIDSVDCIIATTGLPKAISLR